MSGQKAHGFEEWFQFAQREIDLKLDNISEETAQGFARHLGIKLKQKKKGVDRLQHEYPKLEFSCWDSEWGKKSSGGTIIYFPKGKKLHIYDRVERDLIAAWKQVRRKSAGPAKEPSGSSSSSSSSNISGKRRRQDGDGSIGEMALDGAAHEKEMMIHPLEKRSMETPLSAYEAHDAFSKRKINEWEKNFSIDVSTQYQRPSEKQLRIIRKIRGKISK